MSKIVKKWVAGFIHDKLVVVSHGFRQTPKFFIMQPSITDHGDQMLSLLRYRTRFDRQEVKLHDTEKEAINALFREQTKMITIAEEMIASARARIRLIHEREEST